MKSCLYLICEEYIKQIPLVDKRQSEVKIMPILADYIKEHHAKNITLTDIAKKLGYDYNYMSRYFKKVFNMTFSDFVNIYRLETAIKLLEETNKSITDIVYESGFQSIRTFNSFFKNKMGMSPTQYKNTIRK
jgi:AraC-like DNA-binding protein